MGSRARRAAPPRRALRFRTGSLLPPTTHSLRGRSVAGACHQPCPSDRCESGARGIGQCPHRSKGAWMARLRPGARVAVIGAGPGGLVSAKHAIEAGFDVSVFEASDDLGGQWNTAAAHSGIWPGMRTNTSRAMTAFSDYPAPPSHDLHPLAEQIHDYLRSYSDSFGVTDRIRFNTRVRDLRPAWLVDGEPFDAVIVASGTVPRSDAAGWFGRLHRRTAARLRLSRCRSFPRSASAGLRQRRQRARDRLRHRDCHEASSPRIANRATSCRRTWTGCRPTGSGTPTSALCGGRRCRRPVMAICCASGCSASPEILPTSEHPSPARISLLAGHSLCQDYLEQVRAGTIVCRPEIVEAHGDQVTFADGSSERVDAIVCATGYKPRHPFPVNRVCGRCSDPT